jgi:hypothetical protein
MNHDKVFAVFQIRRRGLFRTKQKRLIGITSTQARARELAIPFDTCSIQEIPRRQTIAFVHNLINTRN